MKTDLFEMHHLWSVLWFTLSCQWAERNERTGWNGMNMAWWQRDDRKQMRVWHSKRNINKIWFNHTQPKLHSFQLPLPACHTNETNFYVTLSSLGGGGSWKEVNSCWVISFSLFRAFEASSCHHSLNSIVDWYVNLHQHWGFLNFSQLKSSLS